MKAPFRLVAIASVLVAVFFVLASVQSGHASFRRFYAFDESGDGYTGSICVDGLSVGFVGGKELGERMIDIFAEPTGTLVITQVLNTNWVTVADTAPYTTSSPSPFCAQTGGSTEDYSVCTGLHYVRFPSTLPVGTRVSIGFYSGTKGDTAILLGGDRSEDAISDCRLGTTWVALGGKDLVSATTVVTDSLLFEVAAADPDIPHGYFADDVGLITGRGITFARFSVFDPFSNEVYSRIDTESPYCMFEETEDQSCASWTFPDHGYTWPSGKPLTPGIHRVRASVDSFYSNDETVELAVDVQRTYWQEHRYLPYIDANSSWPVAAQQ